MPDASLPASVLTFLDRFSAMMEAEGLPRPAGRVLALLFVTGESYTAQRLASALEMSRSHLSGAVRLLESLGVIERARRPGSRLEDIRLPADPFPPLLAASVARARRMQELVAGARADLPKKLRPAGTRMAELEAFFTHAGVWLEQMASDWPPQPARVRGKRTR